MKIKNMACVFAFSAFSWSMLFLEDRMTEFFCYYVLMSFFFVYLHFVLCKICSYEIRFVGLSFKWLCG